jgi:tellurite resistance protein
MITDVASYLMEKHHQQYEAYKSSVYYTIDQFIEKESDLLMVLFYVCKADGRFSAAEKTVLVDLLITLTGDNRITAEEIKNIFKYEKSPSKTDFEMMTLNLSNKDIVKKQLVLQAAKDIINTQKQVSEDEQYALNYLEKNLKLDI